VIEWGRRKRATLDGLRKGERERFAAIGKRAEVIN
jgi:hypothetical protein